MVNLQLFNMHIQASRRITAILHNVWPTRLLHNTCSTLYLKLTHAHTSCLQIFCNSNSVIKTRVPTYVDLSVRLLWRIVCVPHFIFFLPLVVSTGILILAQNIRPLSVWLQTRSQPHFQALKVCVPGSEANKEQKDKSYIHYCKRK